MACGVLKMLRMQATIGHGAHLFRQGREHLLQRRLLQVSQRFRVSKQQQRSEKCRASRLLPLN